jgi:serine protease AprX
MRRFVVLTLLVIAALTSWPARTHGQRFPSLSNDLAALRGDRVRVIVQGDERALESVRRRHARGHRRNLAGSVALELSKAEFEALKRDSSVAHISGDLPVSANMAVTNKVTTADKVWQGTSGLLGLLGTPGYKGSGITVAILDSGIAPHSAIGDRVIARASFVSSEPGVTGDPFGHGTHVAGMVGGNGSAAKYVTSLYSGGSAPAVQFVDVRVLGRDGLGYTSEVIAGIDWAIANRQRYAIRVLNLSLGHPVAEPSSTDPLCRAVERAVAAGIVVVASAGNYGQTATGAPILGGVTSPGNSPAVITVGAVDTRGTVDRSDDVVAAYSSRGPTRFDFAVKPDVVAPGTRVVSLEVPGSYIAKTYPAWHVAGSGRNSYGRLSGTSMSTAVVAGGVALLLDAHPGLSPAQVKVLLQSGARFMPAAGLIGGGTGQVDFNATMKMAESGLVSTLLGVVTNLLGLSSGASFRDAGSLIDRVYDRTGIRLLSILGLDGLLGGADNGEYGVLNLLGEQNSLGRTPANYIVWGSVADWSSSYYIVWGSSMQSPSGQYIVWGSAVDDGDYIVWGSGRIPQDSQ